MRYAPDLLTEWRQLDEEGKDVAHYKELCEQITKLSQKENCETLALEVAKLMAQAPTRADYPYKEPSDFDTIMLHTDPEPTVDWHMIITDDELRNKIAGAWIGRISGCLLGKPMECLKSDVIHTILQASDNYPMERYVDSREFPAELHEQVDMEHFTSWQKCWIDRIGNKAPVDDDTNYTVLGMKIIDEYGVAFTPDDVLEAWLYAMPMFSACTAERVAYRNAARGLCAPDTANHSNPYREWIGAQIRGDFYGYISPGNPSRAAEMAWRDASVSHSKNGIYGEMYVASMIAYAAVSHNMEQVVACGLKAVPEHSRLANGVHSVLAMYRQGISERQVFGYIHEKFDEYDQHDWCHVISNAMVVTACLLYSANDFGKGICMAVQTGFDTDCNAATVGSILGMMLGERMIPKCWPNGFGRTLRTSINGYTLVTVDQLVDKTMELIHRGW